jgi:GNAT superfamily N-acetyltransferase
VTRSWPALRTLTPSDLAAIRDLAAAADAEGFRFLSRFLADLDAGRVAFDTADTRFLGAAVDGRLVAVGGVTPDPYAGDPQVGRVRHLYVSPQLRKQGIGRELVSALEAWALQRYRTLRLRTDTDAAAQFYECLGYDRIADAEATHSRRLVQAIRGH